MNPTIKQNLLRIAAELIEVRFGKKVNTIEFEDGSGSKFVVTYSGNPLKKYFVKL